MKNQLATMFSACGLVAENFCRSCSMYHSDGRQRGFVFRKLMLLLAVPPLLIIPSFNGGRSAGTLVEFVDVTSEAKINFKHEDGASKEKLMVETFGSGVAWIDYDNDGYIDLFFVNGANLSEGKPSPGNVLYRNTGKGTFVDVTKEAGLAGNGGFGTGVARAGSITIEMDCWIYSSFDTWIMIQRRIRIADSERRGTACTVIHGISTV